MALDVSFQGGDTSFIAKFLNPLEAYVRIRYTVCQQLIYVSFESSKDCSASLVTSIPMRLENESISLKSSKFCSTHTCAAFELGQIDLG